MVSLESKDALLQLVRLGIRTSKDAKISKDIDWESVETLAEKQGVLGVVYDGIIRLAESAENVDVLPLTVKLRWMGKVMQGYEQRYLAYRKAVADLGAWYHAHGYRMMVLKGLACGLDWPKPEHRPYGDIDIWLFGQQQAADKELVSSFRYQDSSFKIDNSHHHHTVFPWQGFTVENHYDFGNVYHHKSSRKLEAILKELADDGLPLFDYCLQPSANLHALFLLKHSMTDFAAFYVTLRQVLDWGFFVKVHGKEVDWVWLECVLLEYHMLDFFNTINAICVEDLGFDASLFPSIECAPLLKEKVLNDILEPEFTRSSPKKIIPRLMHKYRRWKGNEWKHKMCYNESMRSSFWSGVKLHLMKPSSI